MTRKSSVLPVVEGLALPVAGKIKLSGALRENGFEDPVATVLRLKGSLFGELRNVYVNTLGVGDFSALVAAYQRAYVADQAADAVRAKGEVHGDLEGSKKAEDTE